MSNLDSVQKLTCIEGFCGAGGMSLGLKQAGFDIKLAF
ncbi:DNA cytosine methyltransferase, partial [Salmonella enterica]|nr:DNA cytosine methyltransferase [Salmonella enterica]